MPIEAVSTLGPVMAAGPMRLLRFAWRSFDVDEAQTSIDFLGRDFRMDENIDAGCVVVGADVGALRLFRDVRAEILGAERTVLRPLLCERKRLREQRGDSQNRPLCAGARLSDPPARARHR